MLVIRINRNIRLPSYMKAKIIGKVELERCISVLFNT